MALSADRRLETVGPVEVLDIESGAADELYQGALVNAGTDGLIKVAADVTAEVCLGVMKKGITADAGTTKAEVIASKVWVPHSGAAQTDVGALFYATADDTLADSASNVLAAGLCVGWKSGYVLIDFRRKTLGD
tara:strand:+ start:2486 stop:2887 length:402 start_codon:yes stop_codon:yes gene_type:complete